MEARLPSHFEIQGLVRAVQQAGGFATVLHKGERDAGTILIVTRGDDARLCLYERMPDLDGNRIWIKSREEPIEKEQEFNAYWQRRVSQDSDVWLIELEIAQPERFVG